MQSAYLNHSRRLLSAMIIVCVLFQNSLASGFYQVAQTQTNQSASTDIHVLASTGTVEREIKGGEVHQYQLSVAKDQYFRVSIEQDNMDLEVQVFDASGKRIFKMDRAQGLRGTEQFYLLEDSESAFKLNITTIEKLTTPGRYTIKVESQQPASEENRQRAIAEKTLMEGEGMFSQSAALEVKQQALAKYEQALPYFRSVKDKQNEAQVLHRIGQYYLSIAERQKALGYYEQALALRREVGDRAGEANTLNGIGRTYEVTEQSLKAIEHYQQALLIKKEIGDRQGEVVLTNNLAFIYMNFGEADTAIEYYQKAYNLARTIGDRGNEALLLNNLGQAYYRIGEREKSLRNYQAALPIFEEVGDRKGVSYSLTNMGQVYLLLEDTSRSQENFQRALQIAQETGDLYLVSAILQHLGTIARRQGEPQKAIEYYEQGLKLAQELKIRYTEAVAHYHIGSLYKSLDDRQKVFDSFQQSLAVAQISGYRGVEADALKELGKLSDDKTARDYFSKSLNLFRVAKDRSGEAYLLLDFARLEERTGNLNAAREYGENAINIIESQRESFSNDELRASFAAGSRGFYDFQIGLLMKLHALDRTKGNDAIAFQLSERSRARGLLNVLNEARAEVMQGGDRTLLEREKRLRVQINDKARRLTQALSSKASEKRGEAIEKELNTLLADLQTVRAQIRISSPRYAALTQPQPLAVKELQAKLDDNTVLLEYALMPERSFLWAVSRNAFKSYEVPKHSEIETLSRRAYELFTRSHERAIRGQAQLAAAELSQKILGPVAAELKGKRLIIVGDGALQYVPFAALPEPANIEKGAVDEKTILHPLTSNPQPLIINHDLVYLPSASLLSLLGQERGSVKQAEKTIAVLADPVFQLNDQRVTKSLVARNSPQVNTATLMAQTRGGFDQLTRSASETGTAGFARLPYTRQEAEAIFSLTSTRDGLKALDFKANRESATSKELSQYRILHFATHGLINSQHPELSGLVLSLVDEKGEPQDGFLRLHDIYNLNLNADLVVLSACRTALGKEVNGEGLIGLTRGFMYAGAKSVIASLWDVRDEATAELMKRFYHNMLKQGQLPSAALRAAQISVLQEPRWSAPYFWAGFTMQGAWK